MVKLRITWTEDMIREVYKLRNQGCSVMVISEKIGVDCGSFRRFRQQNDLKLKPLRNIKSVVYGVDSSCFESK